jgi:hypothetical protein
MDGWSLEYTIDVDKERRLVLVKIFGSWRGEHAERYHRDFEEQASELFDKPWARFVDLANWKTSRSEVIDRIAEHMHWCRERNNVLAIYSVNHPSTYRQIREMINKGGIQQSALVTRTADEARKYLDEHWIDGKLVP